MHLDEMSPDVRPALPPTASTQALAAALPRIVAAMAGINRLFDAGHRREAIGQFHALASVAIRTQRQDLDCIGYVIQGHTTDISVCRIPARPRAGKPLALFVPGLLASLPLTAARVLAFADLFDIVLCELPGHGASGQTADVSLEAFAMEYAAVIANVLSRAAGLFVIGESLGGLVGLALARLRSDMIRNVVLLDPPFHLTRPDVAEWISAFWRHNGSRPYVRRVCREIMGFDPADRRICHTTLRLDLVREAPFNCLLIPGSDRRTSGAGSVVDDADIAALQAANPAMLIAPRVCGTGHAVLLDNPDGVRAALETFIVAGIAPR
jgi:pimeloyl-ACP methyl ester carboxylesterase